MLDTSSRAPKIPQVPNSRFAIVASRFNPAYVHSMVRAAEQTLKAGGAARVDTHRVPGAFEIPVVAATLARSRVRYDAVLCFGVILQGETTHAQHIGQATSHALAQLQVETGVPMIHGVYLFDTPQQAEVRCLDPKHNRGRELARTALEMALLLKTL